MSIPKFEVDSDEARAVETLLRLSPFGNIPFTLNVIVEAVRDVCQNKVGKSYAEGIANVLADRLIHSGRLGTNDERSRFWWR